MLRFIVHDCNHRPKIKKHRSSRESWPGAQVLQDRQFGEWSACLEATAAIRCGVDLIAAEQTVYDLQ